MMKFFKKLTCLLLAGSIVCSLTSCIDSSASSNGSAGNANVNANLEGEPVSFGYASSNGKAIWLTNRGTSDYKIVIPAEASDTEKHAAEELQYFIKESTMCTLPIITDQGLINDNSKHYLSVGNTTLLSGQTDVLVSKDNPRNAPVIQTRENTVYIAGAYDEGTLYAVYKFLHYQIGFEAYAVDCVEYDYHTTLRLLDFDYAYIPGTSYSSGMYEVTVVDNLVGLGRMCMRADAYTYDAKLWGTWCHSTEGLAGNVATMKPLHPEWYGWYDEDGDGIYESEEEKGNGQMCQTNDELMQHLAAESVKRLDSTGALYTMLGGSDTSAVCGCANCEAAYAQYGGAGGVHIRYLNKIASYMEEIYESRGEEREFVLYGLAYWGYVASPTTPDENGDPVAVDESVYCNDNVGICYTPIGACWTHSLDDETCETNQQWHYHLRAYDMLTDNLAIYGYTTNFHGYFVPLNDWNSYQGNAELYKKHDVKLVVHQGNAQNKVSPFQSLRIYLQGKLAWDPTISVEETIDSFMESYYGAAAKDMRRFYNAQAEHFEWINSKKGTSCGSCYAPVTDASCWPYDKLQQFQAILNSASNAIAISSATAEKKTQQSKNVYKEYLMIKAYEYLNFSNRYTEAEKAAVKAELLKSLQEMGVTRAAEHAMLEIK